MSLSSVEIIAFSYVLQLLLIAPRIIYAHHYFKNITWPTIMYFLLC